MSDAGQERGTKAPAVAGEVPRLRGASLDGPIEMHGAREAERGVQDEVLFREPDPAPGGQLPAFDVSLFCVSDLAVRVIEDDFAQEWRVGVLMNATHTTDGERTCVANEARYPFLAPRAAVYAHVRRQILRALEHELDECLFVDGVRPADPHKTGKELKLADCTKRKYVVVEIPPNTFVPDGTYFEINQSDVRYHVAQFTGVDPGKEG